MYFSLIFLIPGWFAQQIGTFRHGETTIESNSIVVRNSKVNCPAQAHKTVGFLWLKACDGKAQQWSTNMQMAQIKMGEHLSDNTHMLKKKEVKIASVKGFCKE